MIFNRNIKLINIVLNNSCAHIIRMEEMKMPVLNLPPMQLKLQRGEDGVERVWDRLRERFVALTPEEWVRQHFVNWLITCKGFSPAMMANEIGVHLNGMQRRCDTVVYGRDMKPMVIVEYKAPDVKITQDVFDQIARYNMVLHAAYLIVSNGISHYCCRIDYPNNTYHFIPVIPDYHTLVLPFSEQ